MDHLYILQQQIYKSDWNYKFNQIYKDLLGYTVMWLDILSVFQPFQ